MPQKTPNQPRFGNHLAFPQKESISLAKKTTGGDRRAKQVPVALTPKCTTTRPKLPAGQTVSRAVPVADFVKFGTTFLCSTTKPSIASLKNYPNPASTLAWDLSGPLLF